MIILLTGNNHSGKSTVSKYLDTKYGFQVFSLGDPLKEACALMSGDIDRFHSQQLKEEIHPNTTITSREILIRIANEARAICEDVFGRRLVEIIQGFKDHYPTAHIVVDDLRDVADAIYIYESFPNAKIKIVQVNDGKLIDKKSPMPHYELDNKSKSPALYGRIDEMMKKFKEQ